MFQVLTRQELYDLVWERAVSKVAPEYGISDVALRKQCKKHCIPLPDAVYWGRRHAGRPVTRKPLPALPEGVSDRIVINGRASTPVPQAIEAAVSAARAVPTATEIPETFHRSVVRTLSIARKAQVGERGVVSRLGPEAFRLRVPLDGLQRVGKLLNMIVRIALARGYQLRSSKDGLDVVIEGEAVPFTIVQAMRQSRHVETDEERRRLERWDARHRHDWDRWSDRPTIPRYDYTPSGGLSLEIERWSNHPGAQRRFVDTRARLLEDRVEDIVVAFAAWGAAAKIDRAEAEERARRAEEAHRRREEAARQARLEEQRTAYLMRKLDQQNDRDRLRAFISDLEGASDAKGEGLEALLVWSTRRLAVLEAALTAAVIDDEVRQQEAFAGL